MVDCSMSQVSHDDLESVTSTESISSEEVQSLVSTYGYTQRGAEVVSQMYRRQDWQRVTELLVQSRCAGSYFVRSSAGYNMAAAGLQSLVPAGYANGTTLCDMVEDQDVEELVRGTMGSWGGGGSQNVIDE